MFDRVLIFLVGMLLSFGSGAAQKSSAADSPGASESSVTLLKVQMQERVSSADARNGQILRGQLTEAVTIEGRVFAVGAPVTVTVVAVAKAGEIDSAGELSLQVEAVGQEEVLSDVIVILGKKGTNELGKAPAKGTEAVVEAKSVLTFHVFPLGLAYREPRPGQGRGWSWRGRSVQVSCPWSRSGSRFARYPTHRFITKRSSSGTRISHISAEPRYGAPGFVAL